MIKRRNIFPGIAPPACARFLEFLVLKTVVAGHHVRLRLAALIRLCANVEIVLIVFPQAVQVVLLPVEVLLRISANLPVSAVSDDDGYDHLVHVLVEPLPSLAVSTLKRGKQTDLAIRCVLWNVQTQRV